MKSKAIFIYLISPTKINKTFYYDLRKVLKTKKVSYFQLRLKKIAQNKIIKIANKIKKITRHYNVKLIINDCPYTAKKVQADGCHLGQSDINIDKARKILKNKIIGITCHNSLKLAKKAIKDNADYIALGAFNRTKTKKIKFKASISDLKKIRKISKKPIVVVGGINEKNYKKLMLNKADFLAISSFIWKNKKLQPVEAISKFK